MKVNSSTPALLPPRCSTSAVIQLLEDGDSWPELLQRVKSAYSVPRQRIYELTNVCLSGGEIYAERSRSETVRYFHRN